jgi:hypothetical protein
MGLGIMDEVCFDPDGPAQKAGNEHLEKCRLLMERTEDGRLFSNEWFSASDSSEITRIFVSGSAHAAGNNAREWHRAYFGGNI